MANIAIEISGNATDIEPPTNGVSSSRDIDGYIEYLTGYISFIIFVIGLLGACAQVLMRRAQSRHHLLIRDMVGQMGTNADQSNRSIDRSRSLRNTFESSLTPNNMDVSPKPYKFRNISNDVEETGV